MENVGDQFQTKYVYLLRYTYVIVNQYLFINKLINYLLHRFRNYLSTTEI